MALWPGIDQILERTESGRAQSQIKAQNRPELRRCRPSLPRFGLTVARNGPKFGEIGPNSSDAGQLGVFQGHSHRRNENASGTSVDQHGVDQNMEMSGERASTGRAFRARHLSAPSWGARRGTRPGHALGACTRACRMVVAAACHGMVWQEMGRSTPGSGCRYLATRGLENSSVGPRRRTRDDQGIIRRFVVTT